MKKIALLFIILFSASVEAKVLCRSTIDYTFEQWFPGYTCPAGFYFIKIG